MKQLWQEFVDELTIYWMYLKAVIDDFINPKPPTGMA